MAYDRDRLHGVRTAITLARARLSLLVPLGEAVALVVAGVIPSPAGAQQPATVGASLVFDGATVVDVEQGKLVPDQRVVITGNRIQAVGPAGQVRVPQGAQRVDARGKYLMPGLWDLHTHSMEYATNFFYPLFIASGVTGIRDAASNVPLDTLLRWRREILAGTRMGPPRQILSGKSLDSCEEDPESYHSCISSTANVQHYVDSLKTAGVDMLKMYGLTPEMYFSVAAAARRAGIPFGGHAEQVTATEASDSGARIIDHFRLRTGWPTPQGQLFEVCVAEQSASIERCQLVAERLRRNDTWLLIDTYRGQASAFDQSMREFWVTGSLPSGNWLRPTAGSIADSARVATVDSSSQSIGGNVKIGLSLSLPFPPADRMRIIQRVDLPILAGTDVQPMVLQSVPPGFGLHWVLQAYIAEGLTPLTALRAATLNPAKMLHATDSLGTVAPGKLADLVLLDANPLADITNTTTIRAVVANGRYFDRTTLDSLLVEVQKRLQQLP
jgi:predicted amidohydrolase